MNFLRPLSTLTLVCCIIFASANVFEYDAMKTARLLKDAVYGYGFVEECPNDKCAPGTSITFDFSSVPCVANNSCFFVSFDTKTEDTLDYTLRYGTGEEISMDSFTEFDFSKGTKITLSFPTEFPDPVLFIYEYSMFVVIETRYSEDPVSGILSIGSYDGKSSVSAGPIDFKTYKKFMTIDGKESDYVVSYDDESEFFEIQANADYIFRLKEFMNTVYPDLKAVDAYYRLYTSDRSGDLPMYIPEIINGDYEKRGLYVYHANKGTFSTYSLSGIMGYFNDPETRTMAIAACVVAGLLVVGLCILGCYCCCCRKKPIKQAFGGMSQPQNQPRPPQSFAGGMPQQSFQGPPQGMMGGPRY